MRPHEYFPDPLPSPPSQRNIAALVSLIGGLSCVVIFVLMIILIAVPPSYLPIDSVVSTILYRQFGFIELALVFGEITTLITGHFGLANARQFGWRGKAILGLTCGYLVIAVVCAAIIALIIINPH